MDFNSKWLAILKGAEPVALKMWDYYPTYEKTFLSFSREPTYMWIGIQCDSGSMSSERQDIKTN